VFRSYSKTQRNRFQRGMGMAVPEVGKRTLSSIPRHSYFV